MKTLCSKKLLLLALGISLAHPVIPHCFGQGTVVDWGNPGQTGVPAGLSGVVAIAAGGAHTVALRQDGTVVAWGWNGDGQTTVPAGLSNVVAIAAGGSHTAALKQDGTVVAWGLNTSGQTTVPPNLSGVTAIAAGGSHTAALKQDGTVVAWGLNTSGQTTVPPSLSGVTAIAAGGDGCVALKSNGTVVAWGFNGDGQRAVPTGLSNVVAIAAGGSYTAVLKQDGTIVAWGAFYVANSRQDAYVPEGLSNVVAIAAGGAHIAAVKSTGTVVAWGRSSEGQCEVPVGLGGVTAIAATSLATVALVGNGWAPLGSMSPSISVSPQSQTLVVGSAVSNATFSVTASGSTPLRYQWRFNGGNVSGATNAVLALSNVQTNQTGAYSVVVSNIAGFIFSSEASLLVVPAGTVVTWGPFYYLDRQEPRSFGPWNAGVPAGLSGVVAIAASLQHTVALKDDGTMAAWGDDYYGQSSVPAGLCGVTAIAAGDFHTLALKDDGHVAAWGRNDNYPRYSRGQFWYQYGGQVDVPASLSGVTAIAAGGMHSLALKSNGTVVAWGVNTSGQTTVPPSLSNVVAIAAGGAHTVALRQDGTVVAWGLNTSGQTSVPAGLSNVVAIAAGGSHTAALKQDGTVVAWGLNNSGQTTVPPSLSGVTAIAAGGSHTAALKQDGTVVAWGYNKDGATAVPAGLSGVTAIAAGGNTVALIGRGAPLGSIPPSISVSPQSQTLGMTAGGVVGSAVSNPTLSVTASGSTPLRYQWRFNGGIISGATNSVLTLSNVQTNQAGAYSVVVSNKAGAITSSVAGLTFEVQIPPSITQSPLPLIWVQGVEGKLSVGATGSPLAYEWLKNGSPIGGAVGAELGFDAFSATNGARYSVRVYNAVGSVTSPEVRAILPTQTNTIPSLVVRPANAPVVTFDGIDPVAGRILRGGITRVAMSTTFLGGGVFYTLDGSEPIVGGNAREYVGPFYVYESCVIRAVAVDQLFVSQVAAPTVAVEIRPLYPVEAFSKGGGVAALGTPAYSGKLYVSNTLVNATATASNGWSLLNWNGAAAAGTNIAVRATSATRLEAVFGTVLSTVGGGTGSGTIEASPMLSLYPYGTEVKLLARPQAGSYLFRWQPLATVQNPISVTVTNAGITNSAVFSPLLNGYVSLVADVVGSGQVAQNPLQGQYLTGSAVTLTAVPAAQHRFVRWQGDIAATSNPLNLTLTANTSVQAVFEPDIRIIHEPAARDVVVGATAIFSVGATGPGTLTYQWRKNGQPLAGENGVLLVVRTTAASGISVYDVVVTSGATSITSAGAALRAYAPSAVFAWGVNNFGQLNVPAGLTNAVTVAAGNTHSLGVNQQGAVLAWGDSSEGKLVVPQALSNVTCIAAGNDFSLAGDRLGRVYAWGRNNYGQLNLPLALLNAVQISAGDSFCVGLSATGEVVAWGRNDFGQTNVPFGLTNVTAVAAGGRHAAAMLSDGRVVAWGANNAGQASIPAGLSNVVAIAAGGDFSLALRRDGTVVGWGSNAEGQTTIPAAATNVQAVACGVDHSLALRADGSLLAWGRNDQGQLNFPPGLTNAVAISANSQFSVGIRRGLLNTNTPPTLTTQPLGQTVGVGSNVTYSVTATGTAPLAYQWRFNGTPIAGATNAAYALFNVQTNQAGSYSVVVTNLAGSATSSPASLTVNQLSQTITFAAIPNKLTTDAPFALSATASSGLAVSYTSSAASVATISGSTVTIVGAGTATITAMQAGNATYAAAPTVTQTLTVYAPPAITTQPLGQTVGVGSNATFSITATGTAPLSYQWRHNGTPISGATTESLALTNVNRANAGSYAVVVTNAGGSVTSSPALLRVLVPQRLLPPERLGDGRFRLRFGDFDGGLAGAGELGAFEVHASTDAGTWVRLTNGLSIVNGQVQIEDASAPGLQRRFYRIIER